MTTLPLHGRRVLISGAGVAGPALAYWLTRYGAETTVVEVARSIRTTGFAVDFRGPTHLGVLRRMGVLDELQAIQTHAGAMRCVDEQDRTVFELPAAFAGGDVEVYRRDLSRVLYENSADRAAYRFGDRIETLTDTGTAVEVQFASGAEGTYDLVVGADGIHSAVRALAFGAESRYVRHLGYHLAGWNLDDRIGADPTPHQYNVPGRMASVAADQREPGRAVAFLVWSSPPLDTGWHDVDRQKTAITDAFAGLGWHVPYLLDSLPAADELYFDAISHVKVPSLSSGRVALLGDAGFGVTLGGMGVGTGVVAAYVLAGELARAGGDHRPAYAEYERRLRRYAGRWQTHASPGQFLAPSTALRLRLRNAMFRTRLVQRLLVSSSSSLATGFDLPDYADQAA